MRILLTTLPSKDAALDHSTSQYYISSFVHYPPLGLLAIAAGLGPEHPVTVIDAEQRHLAGESLAAAILATEPDLVGISALSLHAGALVWLARRLKELRPHLLLVAGGPHLELFAAETLRAAPLDYVLTGFAEITFPRLVNILAAGGRPETAVLPGLWYRAGNAIQALPPLTVPDCIDDLPLPRRDLIALTDYYTLADRVPTTTLYTSRGCPNRCTYCSVIEKRWHYRSPERVVEELREIAARGFRGVHILDDTFNLDRERAANICRLLRQSELRLSLSVRGRIVPFDEEFAELFVQAGGRRWAVGVESLDQRILDAIGKGTTVAQIERFFAICNRYKIETVAFFMMGFPGETARDRENLYHRVLELGATFAYFNTLFPYPGTAYYRQLLADGTYPCDYWQEYAANPTPGFALPPPRAADEHARVLQDADRFAFRFYCCRPRFLLREFFASLRSPRLLLGKIRTLFELFLIRCRRSS